jgi:hypothetical protein
MYLTSDRYSTYIDTRYMRCQVQEEVVNCGVVLRDGARRQVTGRDDQQSMSLRTHIPCTERDGGEGREGQQLASMLDDLLVGLDYIHIHHTGIILLNAHQAMRSNIMALSESQTTLTHTCSIAYLLLVCVLWDHLLRLSLGINHILLAAY